VIVDEHTPNSVSLHSGMVFNDCPVYIHVFALYKKKYEYLFAFVLLFKCGILLFMDSVWCYNRRYTYHYPKRCRNCTVVVIRSVYYEESIRDGSRTNDDATGTYRCIGYRDTRVCFSVGVDETVTYPHVPQWSVFAQSILILLTSLSVRSHRPNRTLSCVLRNNLWMNVYMYLLWKQYKSCLYQFYIA